MTRNYASIEKLLAAYGLLMMSLACIQSSAQQEELRLQQLQYEKTAKLQQFQDEVRRRVIAIDRLKRIQELQKSQTAVSLFKYSFIIALHFDQLPASLRQSCTNLSTFASVSSSSSTSSTSSMNSPLSLSITPSLFHSGLKTFLFCKSFPP